MGTFIYIVVAIVAIVAIFAWWRYTSVERGARQRDEALLRRLDPLAERFETHQAVTAADVELLANEPAIRPMLFELLHHYDRTELFPEQLLTVWEQGKARLAYWMMHPNELQGAPVEIEVVESVHRQLGGEDAEFVVLRYRMPESHWAGGDWLLGLAGPYFKDDLPFRDAAGGFSRASDRFGSLAPSELVDWYVGVLEAKFGVRP